VAPTSKAEGVTRLIYENANGINNKLSNNDKVKKAKEIINELEADIVAYNEHQLNMQDQQNVNSFNQLFKGGEAAIQSMVVHNVHVNIGKVQEGGTSLMAIGPLTEYIKHNQLGKDETGLGRWAVMTFKGNRGRTQVICGYNPCYNKSPESSTTYQQHRRFLITQKKDLTFPPDKVQGRLGLPITAVARRGGLLDCLSACKRGQVQEILGEVPYQHCWVGHEGGGRGVHRHTSWGYVFLGIQAD
jgi:hypothetical protein